MSAAHRIRAAVQDDAAAVHRILFETGLSDADEGDSPLRPMDDEHTWIVLEGEAGAIIGAEYFGPEPHSDRVWNLYALAVSKAHQGSGGGRALVAWAEADLLDRGRDVAKLLLIDTSSLESFDQARAFYRRMGYVEEARVRDFWGEGDDKITFWKSLDAGATD